MKCEQIWSVLRSSVRCDCICAGDRGLIFFGHVHDLVNHPDAFFRNESENLSN